MNENNQTKSERENNINAIVPLNVKAISLNCSTRLLNQPQSTNLLRADTTTFLLCPKTVTYIDGSRAVLSCKS